MMTPNREADDRADQKRLRGDGLTRTMTLLQRPHRLLAALVAAGALAPGLGSGAALPFGLALGFPALAATAVAMSGSSPARAEDEALQGSGYLNPFPPGDVYPLVSVGDTFAEGLVEGLAPALASEPRVQVAKKFREIGSLMRGDFDEVLKGVDEQLTKEPVQIAVIMLGAADRVSWKMPNGKRAQIGSDEWKAEFARRAERLMRAFKARGVAVYWVGLPNLRRSDANDDAEMMNELIRERANLAGIRYIDSFKALADEQGGYSDMGPDITGKMRRLREPDGVNFTEAGNRKLAYFVEKELRRDLMQAKQDRNIPLAGSEAEQAKINAERKAAEAAKIAAAQSPAGGAGPGGSGGAQPSVGAMTAAAQTMAAAAGLADQKADHSRVALRMSAAATGGKDETVTVDIVRPALPASVIAAVTRKESADKPSQMGESLLDQIAGGITVMSSITPPNDAGGGARRKLSPTQSPYFRVLVKGERLDSRPGRADELVWPRPEPPPFVAEPPKSAKPVVAAPPPPPAAEEPKERSEKPARKKRG